MTAPVSASLRSISAGLERLGNLPPHTLAGELGALRLRSTADLAALYAWHDGTDATCGGRLGDLCLLPGLYLMSINDALIGHRTATEDPRWNPSWLPIKAGRGGELVAVSCDARDAEWGTVMRLRADAPDRPVVSFASVSALFATVAAAYDTDVYYVDDNGRLELDGQGFVALARSLDGDIACRRP